MKYSKELVQQWAEEISNTAKQSTTCSYVMSYGRVNSFDPTDRECQKDILEYLWAFNNLDDNLQAVDFDDKNHHIVVMWYEPPTQEKIKEESKMKKYTLKDWEAFCREALIIPPFEDDEHIEEWFDTHKIHITANDCVMELEYDADAVNEIEFSLQEIHEAIYGDGTATTGNTVGSEYRNATWKDILKFTVLSGWYEDSHCLEAEVQKCIKNFTRGKFADVMQKIDGQTSMNDELEVNFFKLDTKDLWKIFDEEERRQAFKEILCSKIEISELIDKEGKHDDKVVIMDCSIIPAGDMVGWHYGVDFDKNSEDNQHYIENYIERMTK